MTLEGIHSRESQRYPGKYPWLQLHHFNCTSPTYMERILKKHQQHLNQNLNQVCGYFGGWAPQIFFTGNSPRTPDVHLSRPRAMPRRCLPGSLNCETAKHSGSNRTVRPPDKYVQDNQCPSLVSEFVLANNGL